MSNSSGLTSVPALHSFSEDQSQLLEQLAGSPLLANGLVNLIVLEPIAQRHTPSTSEEIPWIPQQAMFFRMNELMALA